MGKSLFWPLGLLKVKFAQQESMHFVISLFWPLQLDHLQLRILQNNCDFRGATIISLALIIITDLS